MNILVFGDDLTGCNAEAVLFRQLGWQAQTLLRHDQVLPPRRGVATIWNTGTRLLPPAEAAQRVQALMRRVLAEWGTDTRFAKRIDSTFRGPIGAEAEAMLKLLPERAVGVVVCAFPASGRTVRGGRLYVHGVPVDETEIARDIHTPVTSANLVELLRQQTSLPVLSLTSAEVEQGFSAVAGRYSSLGRERLLVICDAETDDDIATLARSFATWPVPVLPIDPGPFTAQYFSALAAGQNRVFLVCGSPMPTTSRQLDYLETRLGRELIRIHPMSLVKADTRAESLQAYTAQVADAFSRQRVVGVRTDGVACSGGRAVDVSEALAELTEAVLKTVPLNGLYVTGGEVAYEVLHRLRAEALEPIHEVWPLCILSRVVSGPYANLRVVTKGGSVGPESAVYDSVQVLLSGA
ncbi:MAG: four-carbon acid sugar kinase family protein [Alicyclobacillus herbarius]|uniref:four-carbon acid sugar kinase family protein n=1 Tax=Alicyclobacillus herbarius TaxID=122960 RepID=UPI0023554B68|nr:four-carbon acid sugar kinase family protein [Alicyclobacillus herbarius]MCL6632613.1 four-carbon acid sugar kinase family protein [Alicyclobacillus herbarius]